MPTKWYRDDKGDTYVRSYDDGCLVAVFAPFIAAGLMLMAYFAFWLLLTVVHFFQVGDLGWLQSSIPCFAIGWVVLTVFMMVSGARGYNTYHKVETDYNEPTAF